MENGIRKTKKKKTPTNKYPHTELGKKCTSASKVMPTFLQDWLISLPPSTHPGLVHGGTALDPSLWSHFSNFISKAAILAPSSTFLLFPIANLQSIYTYSPMIPV